MSPACHGFGSEQPRSSALQSYAIFDLDFKLRWKHVESFASTFKLAQPSPSSSILVSIDIKPRWKRVERFAFTFKFAQPFPHPSIKVSGGPKTLDGTLSRLATLRGRLSKRIQSNFSRVIKAFSLVLKPTVRLAWYFEFPSSFLLHLANISRLAGAASAICFSTHVVTLLARGRRRVKACQKMFPLDIDPENFRKISEVLEERLLMYQIDPLTPLCQCDDRLSPLSAQSAKGHYHCALVLDYASASAARGGRARTADDGVERGAAVHCASSTVPPVVFATNGFYAAPVAAAAPTLSPQQDPPTRPAMPPHRFAAHALAAICAVRTPARARQNRMVSFAEHEAAAASGALMEVQPRRPRQPWAATAARRGAYPFTTRSSGSRTPSTPRTTRACRSRPLNIAGTTLMEMFTVGASYPFNAGIPYCD
ncbi:hypothetical protein GGX14DRAFT_393390 [Mycena pura]|uniref:Uncharacterized protein n=1 Tax=Mycena pura TaxID=153505 RepID=A0AAD6VHM7_9AGAR|nr:hypothetical protein GGX14DRAFT_393390 [Mycena pura]